MDLIPRAGGDEDRLIDTVVYCGINSVVSILGILGNVLLLIIFLHPSLIAHQCLFHSYLKAIALADLLYLLYAVMFNTVVCLGYTDPPVEVATQAMAEFLKVLVTHPQVLSAPSDFPVCLMTLNRLRVILRVKEKRSRDAGRPKPILLQVLSVYILSFVLDSPNWFMFSIQVTESDLSHLQPCKFCVCAQSCGNHSLLNGTECWSYVANTRYFTDEKTLYNTLVILQCIFIKVLPALGIIIMNIIIVCKVVQSVYRAPGPGLTDILSSRQFGRLSSSLGAPGSHHYLWLNKETAVLASHTVQPSWNFLTPRQVNRNNYVQIFQSFIQ